MGAAWRADLEGDGHPKALIERLLRRSRRQIVSAPALAYANRLSDFLFVAARRCNDNGASDVLWVPGANR